MRHTQRIGNLNSWSECPGMFAVTPSIFTIVSLFLVLLTSCANQKPVNVEAELAALREADSRYSKACETKDLEGFVALNAADGTMYPPDGPLAIGIDSIRSFGAAMFKDPMLAAKFTPVKIEVSQGGDMGYTLNLVELTITGPEGKPVTEHIRDFHVWRKQADGNWKVVVDFWNSEPKTAAVMK